MGAARPLPLQQLFPRRPQEGRISEDHTAPGELEGLASPSMTLTMSDDEPEELNQ